MGTSNPKVIDLEEGMVVKLISEEEQRALGKANMSPRMFGNTYTLCIDADGDWSTVEKEQCPGEGEGWYILPYMVKEVVSRKPKDFQVGGDHYKQGSIQPIDYIQANELKFEEGNIVKYITRHQHKNGAEDIKKIMQYCEFILKRDYNETR